MHRVDSHIYATSIIEIMSTCLCIKPVGKRKNYK